MLQAEKRRPGNHWVDVGSGLGQLVFGFEGAGRHVPKSGPCCDPILAFLAFSEAESPKPKTPNPKP